MEIVNYRLCVAQLTLFVLSKIVHQLAVLVTDSGISNDGNNIIR